MRQTLRSLVRRLSAGSFASAETGCLAAASRPAALGAVDAAALPLERGSGSGSSAIRPAHARQLVTGAGAAAWGGAHHPADELLGGPPPEVATVPLEEGELEDVEAAEGAVEALLPSGPGSEFLRTDALGMLPLGEGLRQSARFHGQAWVLETGKMARLADGACTLRVGSTTVLATAVCDTTANNRRDPLAPQLEVEYREKSFAVGRIPAGYNKREGVAKEHEILAGRRVDRALRPLFPKGFVYDTQVTTSVLSADGALDLDVAAINAASAALLCSDIPWAGPVAAVRVALDAAGHLHVNAPQAEAEAEAAVAAAAQGGGPTLRLLVAVTADRITMLEADGAEVPEKDFVRALRHGVREARKLLQPQLELAAKAGRAKRRVPLAGADLAAALKVEKLAGGRVEAILRNPHLDKTSRARALQQAKADIMQGVRDSGSFRYDAARAPGSGCVSPSDLDHAFTALLLRALRTLALEEGVRVDGRGLIDCRELHCELDTVPVVHGSALFTRGETQSLCTATVGSRGEGQRTESLLEGEGFKRLAVHYSFPAFAVNETSVMGLRRETGHSNLVERALLPVLPPEARFPFPMRLNADTLASNGSSSLAAVCGGSLALWDAGVPLTSLVAGVSMGLLTERCWDGLARPDAAAAASAEASSAGAGAPAAEFGRYELLTDLGGLEDQLGEMDFKVAGSRAGVTACQLDVKAAGGVPEGVVEEALGRARLARLSILGAMEALAGQERPPSAPQFGTVRVPASALGRVIGAQGAAIRELCEATGARVDVSHDGSGDVHIYAPSAQQLAQARARVLAGAGETIQEGERYSVRVTRLADYGAFVEFESGVRALLHISELSPSKIRSVEDVLSVGDCLEVLCQGRDGRGNIKISRKALLLAADDSQPQQQAEQLQQRH